MAFSPDGKTVLTGSDDKTARLWTVSELPDDLPRVADWAEVVTGLELDEQGSVHALDNAAWRQRRERLDREGGPPEMGRRWRLDPILFGPEPTARARAWIERQRWAEAEAAFDEAVLARPFDADVVLERARFHAARSRPDKADDDFFQAYALGSRDPKLIETISAERGPLPSCRRAGARLGYSALEPARRRSRKAAAMGRGRRGLWASSSGSDRRSSRSASLKSSRSRPPGTLMNSGEGVVQKRCFLGNSALIGHAPACEVGSVVAGTIRFSCAGTGCIPACPASAAAADRSKAQPAIVPLAQDACSAPAADG